MSKPNIKIDLVHIYLLVLGVTIGVILISGAIVAPVIFHFNDIVGSTNVSHFESGVLMTEVFVRVGYIINFTAVIVLTYEIYQYIKLYRDTLIQLTSFVVIATSWMFTNFYIPSILEFQLQGESVVNDAAFQGLHKGSEIDFVILLIALTALFILRVSKLEPSKILQNNQQNSGCSTNIS